LIITAFGEALSAERNRYHEVDRPLQTGNELCKLWRQSFAETEVAPIFQVMECSANRPFENRPGA
jgi:hypothetical protein